MHRFGDEKHLKMKLQAFQMPPFLFYGLKNIRGGLLNVYLHQ
jgi:hypothetical protein